MDDIMIHMVENDMALSQKVRDIINCATCSTYTGSVEVSVGAYENQYFNVFQIEKER